MTAHFLAIDGGSQGTKVSVVDQAGAVQAAARVPLQPYTLGPGGRAVHPGDDLWESVAQACRTALASYAGDRRDIAAVGLCGIRSCLVLIGADGRLTESALSWMDDRVSRPAGELDPDVATVASAGGYLTVRLTGHRRDSSASYDGIWPIDIERRQWSSDPALLARLGVPAALLPDLVDPGELLGHVTAGAAAETGLPAGLPVFATANDKAVEALGSGVVDPETVLLSLGTYVTSMFVGDDVTGGDDSYWVNSAAIPGRYLYESGGVRRGMWTANWLRELVTAAAPDLVDPEAVREWLDAGAREIPPGCGGLVTIPDWLAPGHAPHRRGAILGLDGTHGAHHLHRSILEGIALTMRGHTGAMESALGRTPARLVVSGGGSRSPLMMQIVADIFGRPAERSGVADAAGIGAAICAAVGVGTHPDFDTAVRSMTRPGEAYLPDPVARRQYDAVMSVYAGLPEFTDPLFRRLSTLGQ